MRVDMFDFELPESRIALTPAVPRDSAQMLVVTELMQDHIVRDLPDFHPAGMTTFFLRFIAVWCQLYKTIAKSARVETVFSPPTNARRWPRWHLSPPALRWLES